MIGQRMPAAIAALMLVVLAACETGGGEGDTTGAQTPATSQGTTPAADTGFIDPSTATREQLGAVAGMTAAAADSLVAKRPYENMVAVDRVLASAQLTEAQRDTVYARVWKPIDPTTASAEEILLIPGVGARMQHEFEEYRPWRDAAHFRREIGKYVDSTEVERLLRYTNLR